MPVCLTCGEPVEEELKYCPQCGSPTYLKKLTEAELRKTAFKATKSSDKRRITMILFALIILLGLLFLVMYMSRVISVELDKIGGFY
jgi:uncharacterized membrane protein YvbJ